MTERTDNGHGVRLRPMVHVEDLTASLAFYEQLGARVVPGRRDGDQALIGDIWASLVMIYGESGQREKREKLAVDLQELAEQSDDPYLKTRAAQRMASWENSKSNWEGALAWLDQAERWAIACASARRLSAVFQTRGYTLEKMGRWSDAERSYLQALDLSAPRGGRRYIVWAKNGLSRVYARTGRVELARQAAREAWEICDRLGMVAEMGRAEALLAELDQT